MEQIANPARTKETEQLLPIERLKEENKQLKQDILMLVIFIDDIEHIVATMPTFMRKIERLLDYDEDTVKLRKFLKKYREEKFGKTDG
jgi:hypothetical protein